MFWICYDWPFNYLYEDPEHSDTADPKVYDKVTKDPTEFTTGVVITKMEGETYRDFTSYYKPNYTLSTLNTNWHGRCLKIEILSNVSLK